MQKKIILIFFAITLFIVFNAENAHAGYLDPGSGSTLVQTIIATIASIKSFFTNLKNKILNMLRKR